MTGSNGESGTRRRWITASVAAVALLLAGLGVAGPAAPAQADTQPISTNAPATVSADGLPTWQIDGVAWQQAVAGNVVFVAGSFTKARPPGTSAGDPAEVDANNVFAYDITTGVPIDFPFGFDAQSLSVAVSPDQHTVYFGGDFSAVTLPDGVSSPIAHAHFAAFDISNLADIKLKAGFTGYAGATVRAIAPSTTSVYVGGDFNTAGDGTLGSQPRVHLAAFNATDGSLLSWAPSVNDGVMAMVVAPSGNNVIIGGHFSTLTPSGSATPVTAKGSVSVDAATGSQVLPWAVTQRIQSSGPKAGITSLRTDGTYIYGTAYNFGGSTANYNYEGTFAADPDTGAFILANDCHGDSYDTFETNGVMYVSSHAHTCEWIGAFKDQHPTLINRWALAYTARQGIADDTNHTPCVNSGPDSYTWNWSGVPCSRLLAWAPTFTPGTYTGQNQASWSVTGTSDYVSYGGEFTNVNGNGQQGLVRFAVASKAPNKLGPVYSSVQTPVVYPSDSGQLTVMFPAAYDRDNEELHYKLFRDLGTTPITEFDENSQFWSVPQEVYTDSGLTVGSTHRYRFTVTDPYGNSSTSSFSPPVTVTSDLTTTYVRDGFQREGERSWGTVGSTCAAQSGPCELGGPWSPVGNSTLNIGAGKANMLLAVNKPQSAYLNQTTSSDSADMVVDFSVDTAPAGAGTNEVVIGRQVAGQGSYQAQLHLDTNLTVSLSLQKVVGGTVTTIAPDTVVPGLGYVDSGSGAFTPVRVRLQVSGSGGTTTLRARAWTPTAQEPIGWAVSATDTTAALQAGGTVGLGANLGIGSAPKQTVYFDNLIVTAVRRVISSVGDLVPGADLSFADLTGLDGLQHIDLTGANLSGSKLKGLDLTGATLKHVDLSNADLTDVNLSGANLTGATLSGANLVGSTLSGVTAGGIIGMPAVLPAGWSIINGYLVGPRANLNAANLNGANLTGVNLTGAILTGANLTGATIAGTNFTSADLSGATVTGVTGTATWTSSVCPDTKPASKHAHGSCLEALDTTPPTVAMTAPVAGYSATQKFTVAWSGSDTQNAIAYYAVRVSHGKIGGSMSAYSGIGSRITARAVVATGLLGYRYCYQVLAYDAALNPSAWSAPRCVNMPLDDRSFVASKGWTRAKARGWLAGTATRTTGKGVTLTGPRATVTDVGIIATACKTCGSVYVYVGTTRVGSISLYSSKTVARRLIVLKPFVARSGPVRIIVTSRKKTVAIDAVVVTTTR